MTLSQITAKIMRVITVPPFLALLLIIYLYYGAGGYFNNYVEAILVAICIVIIPLLAYPICFLFPKLRRGGRKVERGTAFITTGIGYALLLPLVIFGNLTDNLSVICLTYVCSVILLTIFNSTPMLKASGHACGVFGPMLVFIYAGGVYMLAPCILLSTFVVWSSLKLGRHSIRELLLGGICPAVALIISYVIINII
ncbi:MAG: hypothetical protein E7635_06590 [Ruminococcaceae bacterium]|nr:hypothetical protein [Oscillospiraceae bacterium]